MNVTKINSSEFKKVSFRNDLKLSNTNKTLVNEQCKTNDKKSRSLKKFLQAAAVVAAVVFSIPLFSMLIKGKFKNFGKSYKEELTKILKFFDECV